MLFVFELASSDWKKKKHLKKPHTYGIYKHNTTSRHTSSYQHFHAQKWNGSTSTNKKCGYDLAKRGEKADFYIYVYISSRRWARMVSKGFRWYRWCRSGTSRAVLHPPSASQWRWGPAGFSFNDDNCIIRIFSPCLVLLLFFCLICFCSQLPPLYYIKKN